ncbi:MMPL family transporter [Corynebacterium gerontici]|uniref:Membrane protein YdfJ n=1 Tax=Corynebacterium gerontici TaxID=2079234 RepID=A0A3G6J5Z8_9CORY|nr:MMPL family transporter [Corynebacterium gerontici]AZA12348.1 Membrane protein YdfJ [Corynebacterium gerontici]
MAKLLYRIGAWSFKAKWLVIAAWFVILGAIGGAAVTWGGAFVDNFAIKNTPSQEATEIYMEQFPDARNPLRGTGVNVVFKAPEGQKLTEPQNVEAMDKVVNYIRDNLKEITGTERFGNPAVLSPQIEQGVYNQLTENGVPELSAKADAHNLRLLSDDETIGYTTFSIDEPMPGEVTQAERDVVSQALDIGRAEGLQVEAGGPGFGDPIEISSTSEIIGISVAAVILVFTFGSLLAAGMPLITAVVGVGIGSLAITLATGFVDLNNTTPALAVMIGLAVGIDYALFIMFRYRRERLRMSNQEAAGMAVGTAGSAVTFAGLTVIIALVALAVARITFLSYMGFAAAFTVLVAVLVSLTLVPALLGVLGDRGFKSRRSRRQHVRTAPNKTMGRRWVQLVHRVPALVIVLCIVGLGALSYPATRLHLSLPSDTTSNVDTTQRKSADLLGEGFGDGINAQMLVAVDAHQVLDDAPVLQPLIRAQEAQAAQKAAIAAPPAPEGEPGAEPAPPAEEAPLAPPVEGEPAPAGEVPPAEPAPAEPPVELTAQEAPLDVHKAAANAAFQYIVQNYSNTPDVKHVQIIGLSEDGLGAQMLITPESNPEDESTNQLISTLRTKEQAVEDATGVRAGITGLVPIQQDITNRLAGVMPLYLSIVVGLAILLLMVIFRSFWVPIVAGVGFLLSIGAAFGVTVLFWQEGLWDLVNTPGPIIAFMPIFLIGVCFGLAMDYQVFLVSAMREHYVANPEGSQTELGDPRNNPIEESIVEGFTSTARVVTAAALIMISVFVAFIGQPLPFIKIFGFALGAGVLFDAFFIRMAFVPAAMFLMGRRTWHMPRWLDKILPRIDVEGTALEREFEAKQEDRRAAEREAEKMDA